MVVTIGGPRETTDKCYYYHCGYCNSLTAIRAAIEAERKSAHIANHECDLNRAMDGTCFVCSDPISDASKKGGRMNNHELEFIAACRKAEAIEAEYDELRAENAKLRRCGTCANWNSFTENCTLIGKIRDRSSTCDKWEMEE